MKLRVVVLTALLFAAAGAQARNDMLVRPMEPVLQEPGTAQMLQAGVPLRFGAGTSDGLELIGPIEAKGVAQPFADAPNSNPGTYRRRKTDQEACADAFRAGLGELQQRARVHGAAAVVGVLGTLLPDAGPLVYECHLGFSRAYVILRGQLARGLPR